MITEHDYQWEPDELAELAARAAPLCACSRGPRSRRARGISWCTACRRSTRCPRASRSPSCSRRCERHQAAIVAAHPFRWDQPFDEIVAEHGPVFDALELVSNNVARGNPREDRGSSPRCTHGSTGSSDAHELDVVGCYFTEFDGRIDSIADFVSALRNRRGRPRHRPGATLASGPVR